MPVGESLCWGPNRAEERERAEGEGSGKSEERRAVEVEGVVLQVARCQCVYDKYALKRGVRISNPVRAIERQI
jgi:hypothetical protein